MFMTRNTQGFIGAACFIIFAAVMIGLKLFLSSMSNDYLFGFVSGLALGMGLIFLASRDARNAPWRPLSSPAHDGVHQKLGLLAGNVLGPHGSS